MILMLALAHVHLVSDHLAVTVQTLPRPMAAGPMPIIGASITSVDDIGNIIKDFFRELLRQYVPIGALLAAIYGGWGGIVHITSGGAPDLQRKARSIWWQAATGFVGVLLSSPFVNILQSKF